MYAQFFGTFLLSHNAVTKDQLLNALSKKSSQHMKLGTLAIMKGYMTASEVDNVIISQTHNDCRFGDLAVREGYLTQEQVDAIQMWRKTKLGKPTITIVRKIPFAIFILIGTIIFLGLEILSLWFI